MKSRTSSFNLTVLKKDITRFAPSWILYCVGLLVTFLVCFSTESTDTSAYALGWTVQAMAIVSFVYALINAQLLFGDLFQSRMANALHALPLRRESWFGIHTVAGLLFAFVPNLLMALCMVPFSGSIPAMPWLWLVWSMGTYVFFFGLAMLCAMSVGSRFAMAVVYGIANFGSLLVCWLYDTVYLPLLYGLTLDFDAFLRFSPVSYGTVYYPYHISATGYPSQIREFTLMPENLTYLAVITVIGVIFGVLALVMYRKRHLEAAGDFISAPWLKPVFLMLYTVAMGVIFQFVLGLFSSTEWLYLIIGLLVGFFTGQMLLMRTTRIFVKETFIGAGIVVAVTVVSLIITSVDPLGITRWVPTAEEVAKAEVSISSNNLTADSGQDLQLLLDFHQTALDNRDEPSTVNVAYGTTITYTLKDGSTVERYYVVPNLGTAYKVIEPMLHRPEVILGQLYENWEDVYTIVEVSDSADKAPRTLTKADWESFMEAAVKDCNEGNLIQNGQAHQEVSRHYSLYFHWEIRNGGNIEYYNVHIQIYPESTHIREWLRQQYWYDADTMEVN